MIEIIIPTFKRLDCQITLSNIPDSLLQNVTLVVQPQEEVRAKKIHDKIFVVSGDDIGFAKTIRDITYEFAVERQSRFWILDDDLKFIRHYETNDGKLKKEPMTEDDFAEVLDRTEMWMNDGFSHGAFGTTWNNPLGKFPYVENSRIMTNKYYDGKVLSKIWKDIDWNGCCGAEDFYVNLQLLTKGYPNRVWYKYVAAPSDTNTVGGCSEYRDIDYHNKSMRNLQSKFPNYVSLKEKKQKSGPWKDMTKLSATISWKKAYESSQINTLEEFMQ
tara:strand:+ start:2782 stop:3600 length:819 start_codon:yes stop_codon:yes gene_type:complete